MNPGIAFGKETTLHPIQHAAVGPLMAMVGNRCAAVATTVSLSANGSGSQLSSLMGKQTFIPIIYTDAAIDETGLDETFLQKVRPVVPIEAQIQMGL